MVSILSFQKNRVSRDLTTAKKNKLFQELLDIVYTEKVNYDEIVVDKDNWWYTMHSKPIIAKICKI